jgi:hypothetical protein
MENYIIEFKTLDDKRDFDILLSDSIISKTEIILGINSKLFIQVDDKTRQKIIDRMTTMTKEEKELFEIKLYDINENAKPISIDLMNDLRENYPIKTTREQQNYEDFFNENLLSIVSEKIDGREGI